MQQRDHEVIRNPNVDTISGRTFSMFHPKPEDIDIVDIAHSLALQCRYRGITKTFYSVAEHSVRVSQLIEHDKELALWGLLHDASEAYIGDIIRPLKHNMGGVYYDLERNFMSVIANKFNLAETEPHLIRYLDDLILVTERRDLITDQWTDWGLKIIPLKKRIVPISWEHAKQAFLDEFEFLTTGSDRRVIL